MSSEFSYIAMNRFGYGADRKSVKALSNSKTLQDAQTWLIKQLYDYDLPASEWTSAMAIEGQYYYSKSKSEAKKIEMQSVDTINVSGKSSANIMSMQNFKKSRRSYIESARNLAQQTALANINSKQPLQARLLDFFSNHFSVSRANLIITLLTPTLEVEAIAPALTGHFSEMLQAVTQHPAMLVYLNNERSTGPNSKMGLRRRKNNRPNANGLNENLAREILELHTLGVGSGYAQNDVVELAKAITGWGVGSIRRDEAPKFKYRAQENEPGTRTVLGKKYRRPNAGKGNAQGLAILHDLAQHPATAKHVSYKLAKHFISDNPSQSLVQNMQKTWLKTNGHIPSVVETLIKHEDSWQMQSQKLKSPREFVISACRACGVKKPAPNLYETLEILGHGLFNAGSPAGYPDDQQAWLGASALNSRIEWANHFASVIAKRQGIKGEPTALANFALGPLLTSNTLEYLKRAESKQQALALMLMSPDFQRR